jgi:osmotically inducible protein OsmC
MIRRTGEARWQGDLRGGQGQMTASSAVLEDVPYSYGTRFEDRPGTNPEELIATAHAACFAMALSDTLSAAGHEPEQVHVTATCIMEPKKTGGYVITRMELKIIGKVARLSQSEFEEWVEKADESCPVSNLLRPGLEIHHEAKLAS